MANDIFTRAKAYRKKHPRTAWADCVKACAGKKKAPAKKKAAVKKKVAHKKAAAPKKKHAAHKKATVGRVKKHATKKAAAPRKIKVKIKPMKKGSSSITIGSINKMSQEHTHVHALEQALAKHKEMLKERGLTPGEKAAIRRDIKKYQNNIKASKAHISALKRSI